MKAPENRTASISRIIILMATLTLICYTGAAIARVLMSRPLPAEQSKSASIVKMIATTNPTGMTTGFYESKYQLQTLEVFGRRQSVKGNFDSWKAINDSNGDQACLSAADWQSYDWTTFFQTGPGRNYILASRKGQTPIAVLNVSFVASISPDGEKVAIPTCFPQSIANPVTRPVALAFVKSFTKAMLLHVGGFRLVIDHEIVYNYDLSSNSVGYDARAEEWSTWYVEAILSARSAAVEVDRSADLFVMPIVNGDPMTPKNPLSRPADRAKTNWLRTVISVSDGLGIDSYYRNPTQTSRSDAGYTIDIIDFWLKNYAYDSATGMDKPVLVAENGFKALPPELLTPQVLSSGKYVGDATDQLLYYQDLFPRLMAANSPGGRFRNKLRSFNIWSTSDNYFLLETDPSRYFGMIYRSSTAPGQFDERPAAEIVRASLSVLEDDPILRPSNFFSDGIDYSVPLSQGAASIPLTARSGTDYEFIRYTNPDLAYAKNGYTLTVVLNAAASILVNANGHWSYREPARIHSINLTNLHYGQSNTIDVQPTGSPMPAIATLQTLTLTPIADAAIKQSRGRIRVTSPSTNR